jgi:hypothetical protein
MGTICIGPLTFAPAQRACRGYCRRRRDAGIRTTCLWRSAPVFKEAKLPWNLLELRHTFGSQLARKGAMRILL